MLADAGFSVHLLTTPLPWAKDFVGFEHRNVAIKVLPAHACRAIAAIRRATEFTIALTALRHRCTNERTVEIAYDPLGMLYSDIAPRKPRLRIAHFHECLQRFESVWLERRLAKSIGRYQMVVVADQMRASLLRDQLKMPNDPTVVSNFPLMESYLGREDVGRGENGEFDVVYCGSIGLQQRLDFIIESMVEWPDNAVFSIIGSDQSVIAKQLRELTIEKGVQRKVRFEGWIPYALMQRRLERSDLGILLLDSSYEQFRTALGASNKRYLYMQAGLPQIGDENPGVKEFLEGHEIGRCVMSNSASDLAKLVAEYAADEDGRREAGRRARRLHRSAYNYEVAFRPVLNWVSTQMAQ
ncbi:MAG: glycosyltransferase [Hyphomicrobiaceae bacterium]